MAIKRYEMDEGIPSCLLVNSPGPSLNAEEDTESGKVVVSNPRNGRSHEFANMAECQRAFSGWAFVTEGEDKPHG